MIEPTTKDGAWIRSVASTARRKILICCMPQESPQEFPVSLLVSPVRVKLTNLTLKHDAGSSMRGVGHRGSLHRRLGRQDGSVTAVDPPRFGVVRSGILDTERYASICSLPAWSVLLDRQTETRKRPTSRDEGKATRGKAERRR
jgi:hypothetical protein